MPDSLGTQEAACLGDLHGVFLHKVVCDNMEEQKVCVREVSEEVQKRSLKRAQGAAGAKTVTGRRKEEHKGQIWTLG